MPTTQFPHLTERQVLSGYYTELRAEREPTWSLNCAKVITTNQGIEEIGQMDGIAPKFKRTKNVPEPVKSFTDSSFTVKTDTFKAGVKFSRNDILRSRVNDRIRQGIQERLSEVVTNEFNHWNTMAFSLINTANAKSVVDGNNFFSNTHKIGTNTYSNNLTLKLQDLVGIDSDIRGSVTYLSPESLSNFVAQGISSLRQIVDEDGHPGNTDITNWTVLMNPGYDIAVNRLQSGQWRETSGGRPLPTNSGVTYLTDPRIESGVIYLLSSQSSKESLIFVDDQSMKKVDMLWVDSEYAKENDECKFTVAIERESYFGDWKKALKITVNA